jgi:hypothetical protein
MPILILHSKNLEFEEELDLRLFIKSLKIPDTKVNFFNFSEGSGFTDNQLSNLQKVKVELKRHRINIVICLGREPLEVLGVFNPGNSNQTLFIDKTLSNQELLIVKVFDKAEKTMLKMSELEYEDILQTLASYIRSSTSDKKG